MKPKLKLVEPMHGSFSATVFVMFPKGFERVNYFVPITYFMIFVDIFAYHLWTRRFFQKPYSYCLSLISNIRLNLLYLSEFKSDPFVMPVMA